MILDSSALVAILRAEQGSDRFLEIVVNTETTHLSAGTLLETSIVVGQDWHAPLDEFLSTSGSTVVPFDETQARHAREAYARFGKGSGSPARLNFGDCFSYALAKTTGLPLLFKGDDFTHTDVVSALSR